MRQRFTSSSVHKVDGKGRVSVPAGFRRVLEQAEEPGLALISNFRNQGYIEGYTLDELASIHADIEEMPRYSPQREILVLREVESLSYESMAELLDVAVGTVRSRLHRARSELRRHMAGVLDT